MNDIATISKIRKAHPRIKLLLDSQYREINKRLPIGVRLRLTSVYRTPAEQDILFNQKPKVTNAKGGQSIHNYGLAFDICILLDENGDGKFEKAVWSGRYFDLVVEYFKSKGWEWGGNWKFKDTPHFQMTFGKKWQDLKALIDSGKYIEDNGIKYPLL
jgi:peptidoglycan L-alanyl-D-glutamate endopeptidase CwlK